MQMKTRLICDVIFKPALAYMHYTSLLDSYLIFSCILFGIETADIPLLSVEVYYMSWLISDINLIQYFDTFDSIENNHENKSQLLGNAKVSHDRPRTLILIRQETQSFLWIFQPVFEWAWV